MQRKFSFFKTRIAPTPSGYLHEGNAFNFLLTAALAKQCGAKILLRIDDLDRERYRTAYAEDIFDTLCFLNIQWNEGPKDIDDFEKAWSQRHRLNLYESALEKLKEAGAVFACTCSRTKASECKCRYKNISLDAPNRSWRLITNDEPISVQTFRDGVIESTLPVEMKNFVVRKKDGLPAYQLSSLVDDLHFGIDLVVRGNDLWPSTLAQLCLATQLGEERFASITFYHHPLLTNDSGEKLAKSAGDASIRQWRESEKPAEELLKRVSPLVDAEIKPLIKI